MEPQEKFAAKNHSSSVLWSFLKSARLKKWSNASTCPVNNAKSNTPSSVPMKNEKHARRNSPKNVPQSTPKFVQRSRKNSATSRAAKCAPSRLLSNARMSSVRCATISPPSTARPSTLKFARHLTKKLASTSTSKNARLCTAAGMKRSRNVSKFLLRLQTSPTPSSASGRGLPRTKLLVEKLEARGLLSGPSRKPRQSAGLFL